MHFLYDIVINKSVVYVAGAARSYMPMSAMYLHSGGIGYNGEILSTPHNALGHVYDVHRQSGRTLLVDTLRYTQQPAARSLQPFAAAKICGQT